MSIFVLFFISSLNENFSFISLFVFDRKILPNSVTASLTALIQMLLSSIEMSFVFAEFFLLSDLATCVFLALR